MNRNLRVSATAGTVVGGWVTDAAGAYAVREQRVAVAALARRGAEVEHGDQ